MKGILMQIYEKLRNWQQVGPSLKSGGPTSEQQ